jgi:hypothetical protein
MSQAKLILLWKKAQDLLADRGIDFGEQPPQINNLIVPGNRGDIVAYILMARLIDSVAWVATREDGTFLNALELHEEASYVLPDLIAEAKKLKRNRV